MKYRTLLLLAVASAVFGCSPESRQEYSEAGQRIGQAAQDTGQAVSKDAKVAADATRNAANAASNTVVHENVGKGGQSTTVTQSVEGDKTTTTTTTSKH